VRAIARALEIARSNLMEKLSPKPSVILPMKEEELVAPLRLSNTFSVKSEIFL